ncbi:hypothetical protein R6G99_11305, partial [Actinotignum timonense]|nr:hypothetical protein [Actinotignum timonense]
VGEEERGHRRGAEFADEGRGEYTCDDAATDVGQNAHGLRVQRHYGRSIINTFHATWSVGAMSGGLMSAAAIGIGLSVPTHMVLSGILWAAVALVARRFCLPGNDAADPGPSGAPAG